MMFCFFFFNDTATTEIYTLSLHDALPIWIERPAAARVIASGFEPVAIAVFRGGRRVNPRPRSPGIRRRSRDSPGDRKSTRLNSSHLVISYAVFCLKKKTVTLCLTHSVPVA